MAAPAHITHAHLFTDGNTQYDLRKIAYWNYPTAGTLFDRVNVALQTEGSVATASTTKAGSSVDNATDGVDAVAVWESDPDFSLPAWLQVDFDDAHTISEVDVYTLKDSPGNAGEPTATEVATLYGIKNFVVQYWDLDVSAWRTFRGGDISDNTLVWTKIALPTPITTSKIRVTVSAIMSPDDTARIVELQAWETQETSTEPGDDTVRVWFKGVKDTGPRHFDAVAFTAAKTTSLTTGDG